MKIRKIKGAELNYICSAIELAIASSLFTARVQQKNFGVHCWGVHIVDVRLSERKSYCGNHAKACERTFVKHKTNRYLEGADWVEFNDLINDVLDRLNVEAIFESNGGARQMLLRRGACRRTYYGADRFAGIPGNGEWVWNSIEDEEHYIDCRGKPSPHSKFPDGTPGIYAPTGYYEEG